MDENRVIPDDPEEIRRIIATLPKGIVSVKTIRGKTRYYHQWYEQHKQNTRYVKIEEYPMLKKDIEYRKTLERKLEEIGEQSPDKPTFRLNVMTGLALRNLSDDVMDLDRRDCYPILERYLRSSSKKVCVIYGLRRTGKTTLMLHAMDAMTDEELEKTAYIRVERDTWINYLHHDIFELQRLGFRTVFIDEPTLTNDFIGSSSWFADVIAGTGMRVVLSGTDSLGFYFAENDGLYGKAVMIHTTYIPFREHSRLLGTIDVDDYIRYGGVLMKGEFDIEDPPDVIDDLVFRDAETASRYVDIAIARNIQNSLKKLDWGNRFNSLLALYERDALTGAINRVVEDINHRFLAVSLNEDYRSTMLEETYRNVSNDKNLRTRDGIFNLMDLDRINSDLMSALDIRDPDDNTRLNERSVAEIRNYLEKLDVFARMPAETQNPDMDTSSYSICIQPGMRFCQAQEFMRSLNRDPEFRKIAPERRKAVYKRVEDTIFGHILEEIVLYDTMRSLNPKRYSVFKLFMDSGDFDMVIVDNEELTCALFEIKHSTSRVATQYRHLIDPDRCDYVERTYGRIVGRYVLYRGENAKTRKGVDYLNVENYLSRLPESAKAIMKKGVTGKPGTSD